MIKCEVLKEFTLSRFNELENIKRKNYAKEGRLYKEDTFECSKEMVDYLTGNNKDNEVVVKVIEVEPEKVEVNLNIEYNLGGKTIAKETKTIKKKKSSKK